MGRGVQLSVLVAHCNRSVIRYAGEKIKLFPLTVDSLARAAREADVAIELHVADWPDEPQRAPLADWLPAAVGAIPLHIHKRAGPFNKGAALNDMLNAAAVSRLLFLDCDMLVSAELLVRGLAYLEQGKAWFPGYRARSRGGKLSVPGESRRGTGNAFMLREDLQRYGGWPSKETWGQFDVPVSTWFEREGLSAEKIAERKPVEGFVHLWHPSRQGWNGKGRGGGG